METKKFIIEVEEGNTECKKCPFNEAPYCNETIWTERTIDCIKYNLATMKITEMEGEALLYAVNKTAERTKREVINKAVEWIKTNWREYINGPDKDGCIAFAHWENDFKKAMEE